MFCCYLLEAGPFLMRDRKGMCLHWKGDRREQESLEEGKLILIISYEKRNYG